MAAADEAHDQFESGKSHSLTQASLTLPMHFDRIQTVLALGAHPDDIEIGCGGTLLSLAASCPGLEVHWVVLSGTPQRAAEAHASCSAFCAEAGSVHYVQKEFRDSFFPSQGIELKEFLHQLAQRVRPDLILTHFREDRHQDHRAVAEFTWNAFRHQTILEYEIPKWDGDLQTPNLYVPIDATIANRKLDLLLTHFPSQREKYWFDRETFSSLLRIRGLEAHSSTRYAEGFHARKLRVEMPRLPAGRAGASPTLN